MQNKSKSRQQDRPDAGCDHRMLDAKSRSPPRDGRDILGKEPQANWLNLRNRKRKFAVSIYNKYAANKKEGSLDIEEIWKNPIFLKEAVLQLGGERDKRNQSKLS